MSQLKAFLLSFAFLLVAGLSVAQCTFTAGISVATPPSGCGTATLTLNTNANGTWTQKASAGNGRSSGIGFSIGNKGYVGTGIGNAMAILNDFWEYDPATDSWTQKADFAGPARSGAVGFSIGSHGYVGTGTQWNSSTGISTFTNDFWEYDPATNAWTQRASLGTTPRTAATGFAIGNKGYIGAGTTTNGDLNDFWEYDPITDVWTQRANFGGSPRREAASFAIGNKGYIGIGLNSFALNDFWEYDPALDTWTQKANFTGTGQTMVGLTIGSKGYFCTGVSNGSAYSSIFREYNPATNTWATKASFAGPARQSATGFVIGNKAYVGTGYIYSTALTYMADLWEYDPSVTLAWYNGSAGESVVVTSSGSYTATVTNNSGCTTIASKNVTVNAAPVLTVNGPSTVCAGQTFSLSASGASGYVWSSGTGTVSGSVVSLSLSAPASYVVQGSMNGCTATATQVIQVNPAPVITAGNATICAGQSHAFSPSGADSYVYSGGSGVVAPATTTGYTIMGLSSQGCSSAPVVVTVAVIPSLTVNISGPASVCEGNTITLAASAAGSYSWSNGSTNASISVTPVAGAIYSLNASNGGTCTATASKSITVNAAPIIASQQSSTLTCAGQSATITASGANLYIWNTGVIAPSIVVNPRATTDYILTATNANGCSKTTTITQVVANCTSIESLSDSAQISIYPNPNNGLVTLQANGLPGAARIDLYNYTGQLVASQFINTGTTTLDYTNIADGIYSLMVVSGNTFIYTTRLVKQ